MKILETFEVKNLKLKNRVVMPPMDLFISKDGYANDIHLTHYSARALGQVGLIIQEVTAIREEGRISNEDLGIWDDKFIPNLKKIVDTVHNLGSYIGIQLGDAGRKCMIKGVKKYSSTDKAFSKLYEKPIKMSKEDIQNFKNDFVEAIKRAKKVGYDLIEIHAAHGYLISQFISPLVNDRDDEYGENKMLLLEEILIEARKVWDKAISIRVSADDWVQDGTDPTKLAKDLEKIKDLFDIVHVSTGGNVNDGVLPFYPGYQLKHAGIIKSIVKKPVISVGLIDNFDVAEIAIRNFDIDLVAVGRGLLRNPNWILEESFKNNLELKCIKSYKRAYFRERLVEKNLKRE